MPGTTGAGISRVSLPSLVRRVQSSVLTLAFSRSETTWVLTQSLRKGLEVAELLECASPLALWRGAHNAWRYAHVPGRIERKAAEDCRSPKPGGRSDGLRGSGAFGVRQPSGALAGGSRRFAGGEGDWLDCPGVSRQGRDGTEL
jgi:hypothetical protein